MGSVAAKGHVAVEQWVAKGRTTVETKLERYATDERTPDCDESVSMDSRRWEHYAVPALETD